MNCISRLTATAIVIIAIGGAPACIFGPPPKPVTLPLTVPSLQVHDDQAELTQDGVTITVTPILPDNEQSFPEIFKQFTWTGVRTNSVSGQQESYEAQGQSAIIPEPSFKVKLVNNTGHVVRFTTVVFRLQDNTGKSYSLYSGTPELAAWNENVWTNMMGPDVAAQVSPKITTAINGLQLMNRNVELLNGDEWSGYLVFNLNINSIEEFDQFMAGITRLTLRIAEVPVETSDAGVVTRTTEFNFVLDRTTQEITVTCPAGTTEPSLAKCWK